MEADCLVAKTDPIGKLSLFVTEGKTYATRGTKLQNVPSFLSNLPVVGQIIDLVGKVQRNKLNLPKGKQENLVEVDGRNLGNRLRQLPIWRQL